MAIGNFGTTITFEVSASKILTFKGYTEQISSRWADHNIQGALPRSEFLGADLMTISMTVVLSAAHGVNPWNTREAIKNAVRTGIVRNLVIGGKQPSTNKFVITNAQDTFDNIFNDGKISQITMNLTFKEYVE